MYYRRKILLALIQLSDNVLDKIRLQKLLFLFSQMQQKTTYDFIPYKYGCYSYSVNADLFTMVKKGFLSEDDKTYTKVDETDYLIQLKPLDVEYLITIQKLHGEKSNSALIKYTYINFPYWATKSKIVENILTKTELEIIKESYRLFDKTILFTIGYEGISLEEYLNRLLRNGVNILIDVRKNALSMKYGFSKTLLKRYCESLGIKYLHFPDVGIESSQRINLDTQNDYDKLFEIYRKDNLTKTKNTQLSIFKLLKDNKRIALTCFESNVYQCHRKHLSESIESLEGFSYEIRHI